MASESSIKAGKAWWEITARDKATEVIDKVAAKMQSVGKSVGLVGAAMAGAGTAVVAPIALAAKQFSDYADGLNDTNVKTGISVESLSQLAYVAGQQGTSLEGLQTGLRGMAKFTTALASGNSQAAKTMAQLGISTQDFLAASPEQRFKMAADAIAGIDDEGIRAGMAMKIFGKAADELLPTLALGGDGITQMQQRAEALGLTISDEAAKAFGGFGDEVGAFQQQVTRVWYGIGAAAIPVLEPLVKWLQIGTSVLIQFIDKNAALVQVVLLGAATLAVLGGVVIAVGTAIWWMGAVASAAATLVSVAWTAAVFVKTAAAAISAWLAATLTAEGIAALWATVQTWLLNAALSVFNVVGIIAAGVVAAITSPLGLFVLAVVAAVAVTVALIVCFVQLTDVGQQMATSLVQSFGAIWSAFTQVFGGIFGALLGGEWALAGQIAGAGLSLAWAAAMAELEVAWIRFSGFFSDSLLAVLQWGDGAIRNWANGIVGLWNWLADLLPSIMSKIDEVGANSEWIKSSREVLAANQQAAVDAARAPVAAAKAELDALTAKADAARAKTMKKFEGMKDKAKDLLTMPDFTKTGKADKQQADVIQGTFSPVVASAMASSPVMDAMETVAENTGEANGLLGEIKDKIEGLGMLWE